MMFTKFHENRLIIYDENNEKHALLVSSVLMYSVRWPWIAVFVLPEKITFFNMAVTESDLDPKV